MSVPVRVDLESAVVSYRPAAGEERSSSAGKASVEALLLAAPWRTFRWYFGQRHYSGTYWSSTQRDHVIYESRLELANLLLADFDSQVRQIMAQLFKVRAEVQGQARKHSVDYLWGTADGPVVVDVVRAERMSHPRIALLCAWTRLIIEFLGWSYLVVNEPDPVRFGNIRFLAGRRLCQACIRHRNPFLWNGIGSCRPACSHPGWWHPYRRGSAGRSSSSGRSRSSG